MPGGDRMHATSGDVAVGGSAIGGLEIDSDRTHAIHAAAASPSSLLRLRPLKRAASHDICLKRASHDDCLNRSCVWQAFDEVAILEGLTPPLRFEVIQHCTCLPTEAEALTPHAALTDARCLDATQL